LVILTLLVTTVVATIAFPIVAEVPKFRTPRWDDRLPIADVVDWLCVQHQRAACRLGSPSSRTCLQLAQRGKQDDPPAGRSHLLESLGGIAHTFASELRQAWFVPGIDWNTGNAGPAD